MKKHITWPTLVKHCVTLEYCELGTFKSILIPYTTRISMDVINVIEDQYQYQYKIHFVKQHMKNYTTWRTIAVHCVIFEYL